MRIVLAAEPGLLTTELVSSLSRTHDVRLVDARVTSPDLGSPGAIEALCAEREVIIYSPPAPRSEVDADVLRECGEAVYRLITGTPGLTRFVLLGSLRLFDTCPVGWRVNEDWRPRPTSALADLVHVSAEVVVRELVRVLPFTAVALRLGRVTGPTGPPAADALHVDDAVRAVELALAFEPAAKDSPAGWWPFHIAGGGPGNRYTIGSDTRTRLGYEPRHDLTGGLEARASARPSSTPTFPAGTPSRVVVFGAHGPLGSALVENLDAAGSPVDLLLTDVVPVDVALARPPFNRGAPQPHANASHRTAVVDVRDFDQVWQATEGVDAVINLTAGRRLPEVAFGVNAVGTYNIMRAAVERGITRVVHTGPEVLSAAGTGRSQGSYWPDFRIPADAPPRASTSMYFLSKQIGSEVCRIFAEDHGLEVPALFYGNFRNPLDADPDILDGFPICVSWRDGADAVARALRTTNLRQPYEAMTVVADLPQDKVSNLVAKERLGWRPEDTFEQYWTR